MLDTSCLLVDDHVMLRDGLAMLIQQKHPSVRVACARTLAEALAMLRVEHEFPLVLLDLNLPDSQGIQTLRLLREAAPHLRVIVLSADERAETVMAALDAGAAGYIPKSAEWEAMQHGLRAVLEGQVYVPHVVLSARSSGDLRRSVSDLGLSSRQMDVLRLLVAGKSNKLIGKDLELAPSTVKTHISAIFDRLGVNSRTQAVVEAARMGLQLTP